jgi:hypothetical protein
MKTTMQETVVTNTSATNRTEGAWVRKTGQSGMTNRTIRFPKKQLWLLVASMS